MLLRAADVSDPLFLHVWLVALGSAALGAASRRRVLTGLWPLHTAERAGACAAAAALSLAALTWIEAQASWDGAGGGTHAPPPPPRAR